MSKKGQDDYPYKSNPEGHYHYDPGFVFNENELDVDPKIWREDLRNKPPEIGTTNPYDPKGDPSLARNYIDVNCPCVDKIRKSSCDLHFQSFAACHNNILRQTYRRKMEPMFFQCKPTYTRMMMCFQKKGLVGTPLVEKPNETNIIVPNSYVEQHRSVELTKGVNRYTGPMPVVEYAAVELDGDESTDALVAHNLSKERKALYLPEHR